MSRVSSRYPHSFSCLLPGLRIGHPELAWLRCASRDPLMSDNFCPISFHSEWPLHGTLRLPCASLRSRGWAGLGAGSSASNLSLWAGRNEPDKRGKNRRAAVSFSMLGSSIWHSRVIHVSKGVGVLGLSLLFFFSFDSTATPFNNKPTHFRLQSTGPKAQGATMRGWLTCGCVCFLSLSSYIGKRVSVCLCWWKQGLGNWEWEPPDCNIGCYLGNPGGKDVLNEWVGEGSTADAFMRGMQLCLWIYLFKWAQYMPNVMLLLYSECLSHCTLLFFFVFIPLPISHGGRVSSR